MYFATFKKADVFFYSNSTAFRCDSSGNVLEQKPQTLIPLPKSPYNGNKFTQREKPHFFTTVEISLESSEIHYSNLFSDLICFDGFQAKAVLKIPDYNATTSSYLVAGGQVNNLYICNGSAVYEVDYSKNYKLKKVFSVPEKDALRIY